MSLRTRWIASCILLLQSELLLPLDSHAQESRLERFVAGRVVSLMDDPSGRFVSLKLNAKQCFPTPQIQYFPGTNGRTVMAIDFPGLLWDKPSAVLHPQRDDVELLRVGQFQTDPPVLRISITTSNHALLRNIDLRSRGDTLTINWPCDQAQSAPKIAPARTQSSDCTTAALPARLRPPIFEPQQIEREKTINVMQLPPAAPPFRRSVSPEAQASSRKVSPDSNQLKKAPPFESPPLPAAADGFKAPAMPKLPVAAPSRPPARQPAVGDFEVALKDEVGRSCESEATAREAWSAAPAQPAPSSLTFTGTQPLRLSIRGAGPIKYRSFRLSEPERYVVDFTEGAPVLNMVLPESPAPELVKGLRTGIPEQGNLRLVLDLNQSAVAVKEELQSDGKQLCLTVEPAVRPPSGRVGVKPCIVIDAGHGGSDPGAQRGDLREKDMTLAISIKLKKLLEAKGMQVFLTRSDDTFVSLEDRVRITNEIKPDVFVSVHINSLESDSAIRGIETYYQNENSKLLAEKVHQALVGQLSTPDRLVRKARFYVVNHTPHPAVLAEVGFISNKHEREKLMSSEYQSKIAEALGQGIILYLTQSTAAVKPAGTPPAVPPSGTTNGTSLAKRGFTK